MRRQPATEGTGAARRVVVLLTLLAIAATSGGAHAAEPDVEGSPAVDWPGPEPGSLSSDATGIEPSVRLLALPDDADLGALAGTAIDDSVTPYEGQVDLAKLQEDALERLATLDADGYEGPSLARALEFDPRKPFAFVRDRIGFDPYRGLLRGAMGTLAARSGNSFDRAALLSELLELMAVPTRFAIGELSDEQAASLVERSSVTPVMPLAVGTPQTGAALDWESISTRAGRDYARLRDALSERLAGIGAQDRDAAVQDVRTHAWVQAFVGTDWVDLDPTLPDAQPGDRIVEPAFVADELPDEELPSITISLVADTYDGQAIRPLELLSRTLPAWEAADTQILLSFQPEVGGVGGSVLEALLEAGGFAPHIAIAGIDEAGQPFPVRKGTDIFTGETEDGLETARVRLQIGVDVPGRDEVIETRTLLDRLPPGVAIPADGLMPGLDLLELDEDEAGPIDLQPIWHVMVSTGASSPWLHANDRVDMISFVNELLLAPDAAGDFDFGDQLWPVTVANQELVLGAERSTIAALDADPRLRAFVAEPRVYVVSVSGDPERPVATTDLAHDPVAVLEEPGAPPGSAARAELWYGAAQTATETEFLRRLMSGFGGGDVESVSTLSSEPLVAYVDAADPALVGAPGPLLAAIDEGSVAVVPGKPASARGWWLVDPRDGTTRSVGRDSRGFGIGAGGGRGGKPISTPSGDPDRFKYKPTGRTPTPTCTRANEYATPIGCVSLPAAIAFWGVGTITFLGFAWGVTMLWQYAIGF